MRHAKTLFVLGLPLILAACNHTTPLGPDFGNSVYHNMSMHIINPAPVHEGREVPDMAGTRASSAIQRYDTGTVIQPVVIETTE